MEQYAKQASIIAALALLLAGAAHGQLVPAPLALSSSPSSPSPGAEVTVQAATPTTDKDTAFFDWTVDGKARSDLSGQGKNQIRLTTGDTGSQIRVSVSVSSSGGETNNASLIITASDLSLTYFAETIIPRWYKGKALPTPNSVVDVVAIPEFIIDHSRVAPENLIYRWTMDDQTNALAGAGKQVFRIKTSDIPGTTHQVEVIVEDIDRKIHKEGHVIIEPGEPRVVIYPSTPLGGVESQTTIIPSAKGLRDFAGEAFFFPVASKQNLSWSWDIAGTALQNSSANPYLTTIDTAALSPGTTPITLRANYAQSLIPQSASKTINLFVQ